MSATIEQLDDIPVIFNMVKKMGVIESIDNEFVPHKNWKGISVGELTAIWLCFLISTQDHRLSYLVEWARSKMHILSSLLSKDVTINDFSDDKLELLLGYFSQPEKWNSFERIVDTDVIRVFDLETDILRVDATIGKSFSKIIKDGLIQFGHSKQFRADIGQFKTMLCTLDPMGYPLSNITVSGNSADDSLYVPVISETMNRLHGEKSLFVGDCKLGSLQSRAFIHKKGHTYLCPLSGKQLKENELKIYIHDMDKQGFKPEKIYKDGKVIAKGYDIIKQHWYFDVDGDLVIWSEKRFIIRSFAYARKEIEAFVARVEKCKSALLELNVKKQGKKSFNNMYDLDIECRNIVRQHKMDGILHFNIDEIISVKQIRQWKDRPARKETHTEYRVSVTKDNEKIADKKKLAGWRVYASNSLSKDLTIEKAVLLYRKEYIIERRFDYLKNRPLNLIPLYLRVEKYIVGLINVLLLALRVISLIEFSVVRSLEKEEKDLAGLYAGNPKHKTKRPSVVLILRAFLGIYSIGVLDMKNTKIQYQVTSLNLLQRKLLRLLGMSERIYADFAATVQYQCGNLILKT